MSLRSRLPPCPPWLALLGPVVAVLYGGGAVVYLFTRWPTIAVDAAFFQHMGWYVLQGAVPYVHAWDVNPPVPFAITAVLALLAGGDMLVLHGLSVALTTLVAAASVLLVGWVAYIVTGEDAAAVAAGLSMFVVPEFVVLPFAGVLAQFYALFFGLLALALALRDRPLLAGVVAALSAGSWQAGAVFALLVVGIAARRTGRRGALSAIAGGGVVLGVVVLVFAAAGTDALVGMGVQTVLAPLLAGEPSSTLHRTLEVLLEFGYGSLVFPVAGAGWLAAAVVAPRQRWWIPAGGVLFALQALFVDLDGSTDTFLLLAFVALGVAVAVERLLAVGVPTAVGKRLPRTDPETARAPRPDAEPGPRTDKAGRAGAVRAATDGRGGSDPDLPDPVDWRPLLRQMAAVAIVAGLAFLLVYAGIAWHQDSPPPRERLQTMEQEAEPGEPPLSVTPGDADVPAMRTIYWEKRRPAKCHYRMSWNEARWISRTDTGLDARTCGGWPGRVEAVPG